MAARKFFAEFFGSENQVQITTEVDDEKRRVSISNSGRFRQRNKRRKELQKDTFSPQSSMSTDRSREIEGNLQNSENIQKIK